MKTMEEFINAVKIRHDVILRPDKDINEWYVKTIGIFKAFFGEDHPETVQLRMLVTDYNDAVINATPFENIGITKRHRQIAVSNMQKVVHKFSGTGGPSFPPYHQKPFFEGNIGSFTNQNLSSLVSERDQVFEDYRAKALEIETKYPGKNDLVKKKNILSNIWFQIIASGIISAIATKLVDKAWDINKWFPKLSKTIGASNISLTTIITYIFITAIVFEIIIALFKHDV